MLRSHLKRVPKISWYVAFFSLQWLDRSVGGCVLSRLTCRNAHRSIEVETYSKQARIRDVR